MLACDGLSEISGVYEPGPGVSYLIFVFSTARLRSLDTLEANWLLCGDCIFGSFLSSTFCRVCCYNGISLYSVIIRLFSTFRAVERMDTFDTLRTRTLGLSRGLSSRFYIDFLIITSFLLLVTFGPKLVASSSCSIGFNIFSTFCLIYASLSGELTSGRLTCSTGKRVTPRFF